MYLFTIKKGLNVHSGKKIIPKDEFNSILDGKLLVEEAKNAAKEIIEQAKQEGKAIHQQAKEDGFKEGLDQFFAHFIYFEDKVRQLRDQLQKSLLPLVYKTTKKIIGEGLTKHPEIVVDVVTAVVKEVTNSHEVKVYVNKADLEILEANKESFKELFERLDLFMIQERADVEQGSCIIQTEKGILNANLENQLQALKKALKIN